MRAYFDTPPDGTVQQEEVDPTTPALSFQLWSSQREINAGCMSSDCQQARAVNSSSHARPDL